MKILSALSILFFCLLVSCAESRENTVNVEEGGSVPSTLSEVNIPKVDTLDLSRQLRDITKGNYRHYKNVERLDSIAAYIFQEFGKYADTVYYQEYNFNARVYRNVIAVFNPQGEAIQVVGAHYDVCGEQEGADDNASGLVGLLQLARMLDHTQLRDRLELVAYTLEEPPFFRTEMMGSFKHAQSLAERKVKVSGMICLEMIGYFSDKKKSQDYPVGGMSAIYGSTGDYIALVSKMKQSEFVKNFIRDFEASDRIKTKKLEAPVNMTGVDFSDHLNYWHFGYEALMVTDTAFYRNKNYHEKGDVMETLDLARMACVIEAVFAAIH